MAESLVLSFLLLLGSPGVDAVDFGASASRRVRLLRHDHPAVRRKAALLLAHADPDEVLAGLLVALGDPSPGVRQAAAASLGQLEDERAVPFLARRSREERSPRVLTSVLVALGRCGESYIARHVTPFLEHPSRPVRAAAAAALGHIGDAGQRDALWAALRFAPDDPGFAVRSAILAAFVQLGWQDDVRRAIAELEKAGARRHWASRAAVLAAIGGARIRDRTGYVRRELATSKDPRIVAAAAGALARLGHLDEVFARLDDPSPLVRRAALVALQEANDARALPEARARVETDPDVDVRFEAALVLHHGRHPDADVFLVDALRARDPLYWIAALAALERKHGRSFGRDPDAWTEFLKQSASG